MNRSFHRRVSPSLVVAIIAVALASAGSAVAARMITSAQIKNGTIKKADLAPSVRAQLGGKRGPRGATGPEGSKGAAGVPGSPQSEPWRALPVGAGWTDWGDPYDTGAYRKDLSSGRVDLRGLVTMATGTPASQTTIANLPPGYRPLKAQIFAVTTGEPPGIGRIFIHPDGNIVWNSGISGEKDYTSLSGISFWTD